MEKIELKSSEEAIVIEAIVKPSKKNIKKLENVEKIVRFANDELDCACAIDGTNIRLARAVQSGISPQDLNKEVTYMEDLEKRLQNFLSNLPEPEPQPQDKKEVKEKIEIALDSAADVIKEKLGEDTGMFIIAVSGKEVAVTGNIRPISALPLILMANERVDNESEEPA